MSNDVNKPTLTPEVVELEIRNALAESWGWFLALGIAMTIVGALAVILPGLASLGIDLMLGLLLLVGGVVQGIHAFFTRTWKGVLFQALTALLYIAVGVLLLVHPLQGILTLTVLLAAFLLVEGIFKIAIAFQVRPAANWAWIALSGVVALALSVIIFVNLPGDFVWVLGLLIGINIIFSGVSTIMVALAARGCASPKGA